MTDATITYEPSYTPGQRRRLDRLGPSARAAFHEVLAAMRRAEEAGGPEGEEYLSLMEAVIEEATERHAYVRLTLG
jgi:hypothetical protein